MATIQEIEQALVRADAAGDANAAKLLAGEVRRMRMGQVSQPVTAGTIPNEPSATLGDRLGNFGRGARAAITAPVVGIAQRLGLEGSQGAADAWREDMKETGRSRAAWVVRSSAALLVPLLWL